MIGKCKIYEVPNPPLRFGRLRGKVHYLKPLGHSRYFSYCNTYWMHEIDLIDGGNVPFSEFCKSCGKAYTKTMEASDAS